MIQAFNYYAGLDAMIEWEPSRERINSSKGDVWKKFNEAMPVFPPIDSFVIYNLKEEAE